jgi:hypothetical protein
MVIPLSKIYVPEENVTPLHPLMMSVAAYVPGGIVAFLQPLYVLVDWGVISNGGTVAMLSHPGIV